MINKKFIPYNPEQTLLLPPDMHDWLSDDHLVYFLIDVVQEIDLKAIYHKYNSKSGRPPYDPRMMVGLLLYSYCSGKTSSRKIEQACFDSISYRVLTSDQKPDHDTIASFRNIHLKSLAGIFVDILKICEKAGMVKLKNISIDGSKMRANASKHKAMSYDRMDKSIIELEKEIKELLKESKNVDKSEDAKYGKGKRIDELPDDLKRRKSRLAKIRAAKNALEEEAIAKKNEETQKSDEKKKKGNDNDDSKPGSGKIEEVKPKPKSQKNFTDPDSKIMRDGATKAFAQCYNSQIAVDSKHQIIVASNLTNQANDKQQIIPVMEKLEKNIPSAKGCAITADAGYYSEENVDYLETEYKPYIATGRIKHGEKPLPSPCGRIKRSMTPKERMARKLRTNVGKKIYRMRKAIVEPVFGQIKQCQGIREFRLRGLEKVSYEWDFICASHNLLKLFRYGKLAAK